MQPRRVVIGPDGGAMTSRPFTPPRALSVLLVSGDSAFARDFLAISGITVPRAVESMEAAAVALGAIEFDVVLLDLQIDSQRGTALIGAIRELSPDAAIVVAVDGDPEELAFDALHAGAEDCIGKRGSDLSRVVSVSRRALERRWLRGDITDRRRAEEALRRSEADFRTLLEQFPQGLAIHRNGRLVWVNRVLVQALGYRDPADLVGRPALELVHPDEHEAVVGRIRRVVDGEAVPTTEERLLRADGTTLVVEVAAFPIHFEGQPSVLVVGTDPGARRALTARMMQVDRMHSVGLLALGLGHEINNPLSLVTANVDLAYRWTATLLEAPERSEPARLCEVVSDVREALGEAREGARRVQAVVGALRSFIRPEEQRTGPVNVHSVLDAAVGIARNEIRHRAILTRDYGQVPAALGNEARLGQVFLNLLVNAAQAIPVGAADRNQIRIVTRASAGKVIVEVKDTGAGVIPDHLPHLFEPFFTTKPAGQGTGLGLAICRDIVMKLGGTIHVESELGRGSTFRVVLTEAAEAAATRPPSSGPAERLVPDRLRVLVVDDEPLIGRVVRRCFGKAHDVEWAGSGREALGRLLSGEVWDVVFLDVMMPEMTGLQVFDALIDLPDLRESVVFLTGGAFAPGGEELLARYGRPRLVKPFEARELLTVAQATARSGH